MGFGEWLPGQAPPTFWARAQKEGEKGAQRWGDGRPSCKRGGDWSALRFEAARPLPIGRLASVRDFKRTISERGFYCFSASRSPKLFAARSVLQSNTVKDNGKCAPPGPPRDAFRGSVDAVSVR